MRNDLNYEKYRNCLRIMHKQFMDKNRACKSNMAENFENDKKYDKFRQRFAEEVVCSSGDPSIQTAAKQVQAMLAARSEMAQILSGFSVLIILDDVWCIEDVEFFNFCCSSSSGPNFLSILVTTRTTIDGAPLSHASTLSLGLLNEQEGLKLLGLEMGLTKHFDFDKLDIPDKILLHEILKKSGYLPLAIRMLGRSMKYFFNSTSEYSLNSVLNHAMMALDDTDLRTNDEFKASFENISMYITLDRTFSLVTPTVKSSNFLKLCFGAFAVAFTRAENLRPCVSLNIVLLLWRSLLESQNEEVSQALKKDGVLRSYDVCKILETIGAIDIIQNVHGKEEKYVHVSHDLLFEFGKQYLDINLPTKLTIPIDRHYFFPKWSTFIKPADNIDRSTFVTQFFNEKIVTFYEKIANGLYSRHLNDGHIFAYYPLHILQSNLLTKAFILLSNQSFISTRLQVMGMEEGIRRQMQDIELFQIKSSNVKMPHMLKNKKNIIMELVNSAVFAIVSFSSSCIDSGCEMHSVKFISWLKARGLVIVGAATQKFHLWNISLDCFSKAMKYLKFGGFSTSHPDFLLTLRYIDAATLFPVQLVLKDSPHRIVLKYAASLREGNVSTTGLPLVLSSHPGHAIVPIMDHYDYLPVFGYFCGLGIGSAESAMKVSYDNQFITRIEDGAVMTVFNDWLNEGIEIEIKPGPTSKREHFQQINKSSASKRFIINENGTVSTATKPNLVLGLGYYPKLYLVDRFSANRAIFKNVDALLQSDQSCFADNGNGNGIPLELASHPKYAVTSRSSFIPTRLSVGQMKLGIGPEENALKVVYRKNKLIVVGPNNFHLCSPYAGSSILLTGSKIPYASQPLLLKLLIFFLFDKMSDFSINNDGTISPLNAPHLALGFQQPTFCNETLEPVSGHTYDPLESSRLVNQSLRDLIVFFFIKFFL